MYPLYMVMGTTKTKTEALVPITIIIHAREVLVPITVIGTANPGRHLIPLRQGVKPGQR